MKKAKQKVVRTAEDSGAALQSLVFKTEGFATEESVRTFLDDAGYEGGEIEATDTGFQVVARAVEDFDGDLQTIDDSKTGVIRVVGVVKKEDGEPGDGVDDTSTSDETGEAEVATKSDESEATVVVDAAKVTDFSESETVKKYATWRADWSDETSIREVMAEGSDGLPPGIYELNDAFYTALRNLILSGNTDGITALTTEFGNIIRDLVKIWDFATLPSDMVQKAMGEPELAEQTVSTKSADDIAPEKELDFEKLVQRVVAAMTESKALVSPDNLQLVAKAIKDLSDKVDTNEENTAKQLNESLDSVKKASEANEVLSETVKKQATKLSELEGMPLGSRTLDADFMSEATPVTSQKSEGGVNIDSMLRNELGMG